MIYDLGELSLPLFKDIKKQQVLINYVKNLVQSLRFENELVPDLIDVWVTIIPYITENYFKKVLPVPEDVRYEILEKFYNEHKDQPYFDPNNKMWLEKYGKLFLTVKMSSVRRYVTSFVLLDYLEMMGLPEVVISTLEILKMLSVSHPDTPNISFSTFYDVFWQEYKSIIQSLSSADVKILQHISQLQFRPKHYHLYHPAVLKNHLRMSKVWLTQRFSWLHRRMLFWGLIFLNPAAFGFKTLLYEVNEDFLLKNPFLLWKATSSPFSAKKSLIVTRIPRHEVKSPLTVQNLVDSHGTLHDQLWYWLIIRNIKNLKPKGKWAPPNFQYTWTPEKVTLKRPKIVGHLIPLLGAPKEEDLPQTRESIFNLVELAQTIDKQSEILGTHAPEDVLAQALGWTNSRVKYYLNYLTTISALIMVPYFSCIGLNCISTMIFKLKETRKNVDLEDPLIFPAHLLEIEKTVQKPTIITNPRLFLFPKWQWPIIWILQQLPQVAIWSGPQTLIAHGATHPQQMTVLQRWFKTFLRFNEELIDGWKDTTSKAQYETYNRHFLRFYSLTLDDEALKEQQEVHEFRWQLNYIK